MNPKKNKLKIHLSHESDIFFTIENKYCQHRDTEDMSYTEKVILETHTLCISVTPYLSVEIHGF